MFKIEEGGGCEIVVSFVSSTRSLFRGIAEYAPTRGRLEAACCEIAGEGRNVEELNEGSAAPLYSSSLLLRGSAYMSVS